MNIFRTAYTLPGSREQRLALASSISTWLQVGRCVGTRFLASLAALCRYARDVPLSALSNCSPSLVDCKQKPRKIHFCLSLYPCLQGNTRLNVAGAELARLVIPPAASLASLSSPVSTSMPHQLLAPLLSGALQHRPFEISEGLVAVLRWGQLSAAATATAAGSGGGGGSSFLRGSAYPGGSSLGGSSAAAEQQQTQQKHGMLDAAGVRFEIQNILVGVGSANLVKSRVCS